MNENSDSDSDDDEDEDTDINFAYIKSLKSCNELKLLERRADDGPVYVQVSVNDQNISMEVDSGACHSVMHVKDKHKYFENEPVLKFDTNLRVVTGEAVQIIGYIPVKIHKPSDKSNEYDSKLVIIESKRRFKPLMGRTFLDLLYAGWRKNFFHNVNALSGVNEKACDGKRFSATLQTESDVKRFSAKLQTDFPSVFTKCATKPIKHFKVHVHLKEGAKPIFHKPYSLAYGMREKVEKEIKRLTDLGIIYPVRHSEWATPIIPVAKPNNEIRICADCKVTINKFLKKDHYPLPRFDDLVAGLAGAKYFCVVDLRDAFQQIEVDEDSQEFFTP